jgi:hypothetical protein
MLSVAERIAQTAEHFADHDAHGYSQPNRGTGGVERITLSDGSTYTVTASDLDCSEMVRQCVNVGLEHRAIDWMWTGNEDDELRAVGFTRLGFDPALVQRGDVLWTSGHTGVALGGGMQADAHGDEVGGLAGPSRGDQTGREVERRALRSSWAYIYRYAGDYESATTEPAGGDAHGGGDVEASYWLRVGGDGCNVREAPSLSAGVTGRLDAGDVIRCDRIRQAEGRIWGGYIANSGNVRWLSLAQANDWISVG